MGRILLLLGAVLMVFGILIIGLGRLGLPLGRLPGDVAYKGRNVSVFAPLGTSLLVSVILSFLLWLVSYLRR